MLAIVSIEAKLRSSADLGSIVRRARREQRLTQEELATVAGVSRTAVQKLEAGRGTVNLDTAIKILTLLSLDLAVANRVGGAARMYRSTRLSHIPGA